MITLLALALMSNSTSQNDVKPVPYLLDHCYCTDSDFNARCLKILQVGQVSYRYSIETGAGYKGSFVNTIAIIDDVYPLEVSCEKK